MLTKNKFQKIISMQHVLAALQHKIVCLQHVLFFTIWMPGNIAPFARPCLFVTVALKKTL